VAVAFRKKNRDDNSSQPMEKDVSNGTVLTQVAPVGNDQNRNGDDAAGRAGSVDTFANAESGTNAAPALGRQRAGILLRFRRCEPSTR
jgi:hypothetical protein